MEFREQQKSSSSIIALVVISLILQAGLSSQVSIAGGTINFMLILTAVFALQGDASKTVIAGFLCGLYFDLTSSTPVGLMALLLTIGSFVLVHSSAVQGGSTTSSQVLIVFVFALAINVLFGLALFAMGVQTSLLIALFGHGLATSVLTAIVSFPVVAVFGAPAPAYGFSKKFNGTRFKSNSRLLK